MVLEHLASPDVLTPLVAGVVMLAVATWLLVVDRRDRLVQAFVLVLVLRGATNVGVGLSQVPDPGISLAGFEVALPTQMALGFAMVLFLLVLHDRNRRDHGRPPWRWTRPATAAVVAAGALALLAYRLGPTLVFTLEPIPGGGYVAVGVGPLGAAYSLIFPTYAVVALVAARAMIAAPSTRRRRSHLLVSLGFGLLVLYEIGRGRLAVALGILPADTFSAGSWILATSGLVLVLAGIGLVARWGRRTGEPAARRDARRYLAACGLVLATIVVATMELVASGGVRRGPLAVGFNGLWTLAFALLIPYALVRYKAFGLDVKVKWSIKQSTLAAVFIAVFFVVSETAQVVFTAQLGAPNDPLASVLGILAAGALLFALAPIQRFAERVSDAAMPGVKGVDAMTEDERVDAYRELTRVAWEDGSLTADERRLLEAARTQLGLSTDRATAVERDVVDAQA